MPYTKTGCPATLVSRYDVHHSAGSQTQLHSMQQASEHLHHHVTGDRTQPFLPTWRSLFGTRVRWAQQSHSPGRSPKTITVNTPQEPEVLQEWQQQQEPGLLLWAFHLSRHLQAHLQERFRMLTGCHGMKRNTEKCWLKVWATATQTPLTFCVYLLMSALLPQGERSFLQSCVISNFKSAD